MQAYIKPFKIHSIPRPEEEGYPLGNSQVNSPVISKFPISKPIYFCKNNIPSLKSLFAYISKPA